MAWLHQQCDGTANEALPQESEAIRDTILLPFDVRTSVTMP